MTTVRLRVSVVTAGLLMALLASCAAPVSEAPPVVAPSVEASSPAPLKPPVAAFDVSCGDLVSAERMTTVWGEPLILGDPPYTITDTTYGLSEAAFLHNGGLSCAWTHGEQRETALTIMLLPEAADAFTTVASGLIAEPYSYSSAPVGDGAVVACSDAYTWLGLVCTWNARQDDVWIFLSASFLPAGEATIPIPRDNPDTSRKPLVPTIDGSLVADIVAGAVDTVVRAPRVEVPRPTLAAPSCSDLFSSPSAEALLNGRSVTGGPVQFTAESVGTTNQVSQGSMGPVSAQRLGYVQCTVADGAGELAFSVMVAPDADWIFGHPRYLAPTDPIRVGEVAAWCPDDGYSCFATAQFDGLVLTSETSTGENPTDLARDAAVRTVQAMLDSLR